MKMYAIRPEINNAEQKDYEQLHDKLYSKRIYRVIMSKDSKWYDLPTGMYVTESNLTLKEIFDIVRSCVIEVCPLKTYEIIVFNYSESWFLLTHNTQKNKLPPGM